MKKLIAIAVSILLLITVPANAQPNLRGWGAYIKWRDEPLSKKPRGVQTPHYCLVTITRRLDDKSAQLDFLAIGNRKGFTLEIQPFKVTKLADGNFINEEIGEATKSSIQGKEFNSSPTSLRIDLPVPKDVNAFAIKWRVDDDRINFLIMVRLDDTLNESVSGII